MRQRTARYDSPQPVVEALKKKERRLIEAERPLTIKTREPK